ncbi:MAG TPA: hypothetical protein VMV29_07475 [Ktedonobacterales bacterium]|nr:hypothetical protein [Ktedonobacterales bacterium]
MSVAIIHPMQYDNTRRGTHGGISALAYRWSPDRRVISAVPPDWRPAARQTR